MPAQLRATRADDKPGWWALPAGRGPVPLLTSLSIFLISRLGRCLSSPGDVQDADDFVVEVKWDGAASVAVTGCRGLQGPREGLEAQAGCCDRDPEQGADDQGAGTGLAECGHVNGQADRGQRDRDEEH